MSCTLNAPTKSKVLPQQLQSPEFILQLWAEGVQGPRISNHPSDISSQSHGCLQMSETLVFTGVSDTDLLRKVR